MKMLRNHILPSPSLYGEEEAFLFQEDHDPCHEANKVTKFIEHSHNEILQWLVQSRDLNPIEDLCEVLFRNL